MKNSKGFVLLGQLVCAIATVIFLYPLVLMLIKSFDKNGFSNYAQVFEKVQLWPNFRTSLLVVGGTLVVVAVVTSMAAFAFAKLNFRGKGVLYYTLLTGMMVPVAALVFPLFQIVKGLGLNNTPLALVFPYATMYALFNLMVLKNFFDGLPNELIEAAHIDGAGLWRIFVRVMFPLSIPGLAIVLIQTFLLSWNELQMGMIFINDTKVQPISVVPLRFMQSSSNSYPLGVMYACLVICLAPIAIFYVFAQRFLVRGMTAGAVKG